MFEKHYLVCCLQRMTRPQYERKAWRDQECGILLGAKEIEGG